MQSFKSGIRRQVEAIPKGSIFTFANLAFPMSKLANVAVILSELAREKTLVRVEKGAYYRPQPSSLGLGMLPVYQDEQLRYLTRKLNGYLTGAYVYNKMSLTEQAPAVITIAVHRPVRAFRFKKLSVESVKAYVDTPCDEETLHLVRILDAIKDLKHIPGASPQVAYDRIFNLYIMQQPQKKLKKIVSLAATYPPRVRKTLSDMLAKKGSERLAQRLAETICPTTRFDLPYKT